MERILPRIPGIRRTPTCDYARCSLDRVRLTLTWRDEGQRRLCSEQGWHCLHLYYRLEFSQWQLLSAEEQRTAKVALSALVQEVRALESTQLLTMSVVTPKADLGFMLITPDLHAANRIEKQLSLSLGADVLVPVYSYLSLTEESEYVQ